MRTIAKLFFLCFFTSIVNAQSVSTNNYVFSTNATSSLGLDLNGNTTDTAYRGSIILIGGGSSYSADDGVSSTITLPFDFFFMGVRQTYFSVTADGMLNLSPAYNYGAGGYTLTNSGVSGTTPRFSAFGADLFVGADGVGVKTIGTAPNRCFIIQWSSMALFRSFNGNNCNSKFQIRLYETSGIVEYVYGAMQMTTNNFPPAYIGFATSTTPSNGNIVCVNSLTNSVQSTSSQVDMLNGGSYSVGLITNLHSPSEGARREYQFNPIKTQAPTNLNFTDVTLTSYKLNWTDNSSEELGYVIYKSSDNINYSYVTTTAANATSYNATSLTTGTMYYWRIYALKESLSDVLAGSQMAAVASISSFTPTAACENSAVNITINGNFLSTASAVTLNGEPLTINSITNTKIIATSDATPQAGYLQVVTAYGTATSATFLTIDIRPSIFAGANQTSYACYDGIPITGASNTNCSSTVWTSSGTGYFAYFNSDNSIYLPSYNDLLGGSVTLTYKGYGNGACNTNVTSTKTLSLSESPVLAGTAGGAQVCNTVDAIGGVYITDENCKGMAILEPVSFYSFDMTVSACLKIDGSVQTSSGQPYVQRHFDILPTAYPDDYVSGFVTLFLTQAEFDAFNLVRGDYPALPTGPTDQVGKSNLRITRFMGTGTLPNNYTGEGEASLINPDDVNITWNGNYWKVRFLVYGFGGFYIHSTLNERPLPVNYISFSGSRKSDANELKWSTAQEQNNSGFEIQRSVDGKRFETIGFVKSLAIAGNSQTELKYSFIDFTPGNTTQYYRLKQIDIDGKFSFSSIIPIKGEKLTRIKISSVYPNPTHSFASVLIESPNNEKVVLRVTDIMGRTLILKNISLVSNAANVIPINTSSLANGTYLVSIDGQPTQLKLVKY